MIKKKKKEAIHGSCHHAGEDIGTPGDYIVRLESYGISESVVGDPLLKRYNIFCIFDDPELRTLEEIVSETVHGEPYEFDDDTVSDIMNQICRAVLVLHRFEGGLVHRNINLRNILEVAPGVFRLSGLLGVAWQTREPLQPLDVPRLVMDIQCYTDKDWRPPEMQKVSSSTSITPKSGERKDLKIVS